MAMRRIPKNATSREQMANCVCACKMTLRAVRFTYLSLQVEKHSTEMRYPLLASVNLGEEGSMPRIVGFAQRRDHAFAFCLEKRSTFEIVLRFVRCLLLCFLSWVWLMRTVHCMFFCLSPPFSICLLPSSPFYLSDCACVRMHGSCVSELRRVRESTLCGLAGRAPRSSFFYLWAQGKRKGGNDRCRLNHKEQPFVGVPSVSVSNRRHHCRLSLCSPKFPAALDITRPILGALSLHVSTCLCAPKIPRIRVQTRHKQWSRLRSLQTTWLLSIAAH